MNEFYIQGIPLEPEIAPSGWTDASLVEIEGLPGGTVQVDRFDCRLLLDPNDLSGLLSLETKEYDEDNSERDLDDLRYGDLYSEDEEMVCQGNEFQYTYGAEIWIPPPPPLAPSIVSQMLEPSKDDEFLVACCGPCSLRELAVIHAVAMAVAKKSGGSQHVERRICDVVRDNPGVEFLNEGHVHHCIFVDMLSQARQGEGTKHYEEKVLSSLDALQEYTDGEDQKIQAACMPLAHKLLCAMLSKVQHRAGMEDIVRNIEQGKTWLNPMTLTGFDLLLRTLKQMIKGRMLEQPLEDRLEGESHQDVDSGYPFEGDEMTHVDESTRASRLLKAQMMMRKRKMEQNEKSKVLRAQTVREDNMTRQRQFAQITQHRAMFEDSDDD